jgi:hypothetical protein
MRPTPAAVRAVTIVITAVRAGRAAERRVQFLDCISQDRLVAVPQNGKAERPVDGRKVTRPDPSGLPLAQPDAGHAGAVGQLVVQRDGVAAYAHHRGKGVEPCARGFVHERKRVEGQAGVLEVVPGIHGLELRADEAAHRPG